MTTKVTITLVAETCITCGTIFGLNKIHQDILEERGDTFYCPNGHGMVYRNTLKTRLFELESKLAQEQEASEYWRKSYNAEEQEHRGTKRQLDTTKAQLTKTKKRVSNGVCPCCNRTFKQLARHMENKHPEYKGEG